jgi:uncharacterized protein YndB with AHSA1/START domain
MAKPLDVSLPSDREVKVTRVFEAPARLIFDFHTRPDYVKRWLLGPPGWSMPVCEIDLRVGGSYRYVWQNDADGTSFGSRGEFREIVAPSRIVHTERMDGFDGEAVITLTLDEQDGRTTLSSVMLFETMEARDGAIGTGMNDGVAMSYDRLEEVMAADGA